MFLQFVDEPIDGHSGPFGYSACRVFDRPVSGKKIKEVQLSPAIFRPVLHLKVARDRCDLKALFGKHGDSAREMAGRADQQD